MKRIIAVLLTVLIVFSMIPYTFAAESSLSEVEQDIARMKFNGKAWDPRAFLEGRDKNDIYLIAVDERGFTSQGGSPNYGFYLYFYNPSGKNVLQASVKHKVQMAVQWDGSNVTEYEKFNLEHVSSSSDKVYLKYRVMDHSSSRVDGLTVQERMVKMQASDKKRIYEISSFELHAKAEANAYDYPYGCKAVFEGYEAGRGPNGTNKDTKKITYELSETLKLDVEQCYWRSETSSLGVGYKNQINAAYFAVPNDVWDQYVNLYSITCNWDEYRTQPMIVTDDQQLYSDLSEFIGDKITPYDEDVGYQLYSGYLNLSTGPMSQRYSYDWGYNVESYHRTGFGVQIQSVDNPINKLTWLLHSDIELALGKECISSEELLEYYNKYADDVDLLTDKVDEGRTAGSNYVTVTMDGKNGSPVFELKNYASNHDGLQTFFAYHLFNGGYDIDVNETYEHFTPIEVFRKGEKATNKLLSVLTSSGEIANLHFFQTEEMAETFREYVREAIDNDMTVVLFRYAETDYFSETLTVKPAVEGHTLVSWQTMFLNFDVIQLGFHDRQQNLVIVPVANNPEDVIGSVQTPETSDNDFDLVTDKIDEDLTEFWGEVKEGFNDVMAWFGIINLILLIFGVLCLGAYLIPVLSNFFGSFQVGQKWFRRMGYKNKKKSSYSTSYSKGNRKKWKSKGKSKKY